MIQDKQSWWKFWGKNEQKKDLIVYAKGLKSLLDNNHWCINECDLTQKLEKINSNKFELSDKLDEKADKDKNKKISFIQKFTKKFKKILG